MALWVFYSSKTGNTARLLEQAGLSGLRIPRTTEEVQPEITEPFVLLTPSFGDAQGNGAVPKAVIRFLNAPERRQWLRGVVACGDRNFGAAFAQAGDVIARKCDVPLLLRVEMSGTSTDWQRLRQIDMQFDQHFLSSISSTVRDALL